MGKRKRKKRRMREREKGKLKKRWEGKEKRKNKWSVGRKGREEQAIMAHRRPLRQNAPSPASLSPCPPQ